MTCPGGHIRANKPHTAIGVDNWEPDPYCVTLPPGGGGALSRETGDGAILDRYRRTRPPQRRGHAVPKRAHQWPWGPGPESAHRQGDVIA